MRYTNPRLYFTLLFYVAETDVTATDLSYGYFRVRVRVSVKILFYNAIQIQNTNKIYIAPGILKRIRAWFFYTVAYIVLFWTSYSGPKSNRREDMYIYSELLMTEMLMCIQKTLEGDVADGTLTLLSSKYWKKYLLVFILCLLATVVMLQHTSVIGLLILTLILTITLTLTSTTASTSISNQYHQHKREY